MSSIVSINAALPQPRPNQALPPATPSSVASASLAFDEALARTAHAAASKASAQTAADTIRTDDEAASTADAKALAADAKVKADEKATGTLNLTA